MNSCRLSSKIAAILWFLIRWRMAPSVAWFGNSSSYSAARYLSPCTICEIQNARERGIRPPRLRSLAIAGAVLSPSTAQRNDRCAETERRVVSHCTLSMRLPTKDQAGRKAHVNDPRGAVEVCDKCADAAEIVDVIAQREGGAHKAAIVSRGFKDRENQAS